MPARDLPARSLIRPDRVRSTQGGFAFLPNRFLHGGFFASLNHRECALYLFLVLAADRHGLSYYRHDRICSNRKCHQQFFPQMSPAIIVLVTSGDRCLLGRKTEWPENMYSTLAGFVEPAESLETALIREVREEAGVEVSSMCYFASQPWPFPNSLMLAFTAQAASETIQIGEEELEDACWFTREEIREGLVQGTLRLSLKLAISFHLIENWFDAGDLGSLRELSAES